ncbi:MAG: [protein-PII] uridylyltransferase [Deltaproteobacteria bacterium]|nr:[protein-PII] uridylyltransferase [Deltaproteobacteria bacterium]
MLIQAVEDIKCIHLVLEDYDRFIPSFMIENGNTAEAAKGYLEACKAVVKKLHTENYHAENVIEIRSRMIDRLLTVLFSHFEKEVVSQLRHSGPRAAVIAQGGYGRQEMNVYSDIDLLFLYPSKKGAYIENLTEKILYLLWDLGLEVGYATRTVSECKKLMLQDTTIMTAILDARYLCGDAGLWEQFQKEVHSVLKSSSVQAKLIRVKMEEQSARIEKHGGSVFVLEPNVRDGAGTLRDLHLPRWIAKIQGKEGSYESLLAEGLIHEDEFKSLMTARNFLLRLRNELHFLVEKKVDLLTFHRQEIIAGNMGYKDSEGILGVEKFMQVYYRLAYQVHLISNTIIRRLTHKEKGLSEIFRKIKVKSVDDHFRIVDDQIAAVSNDLFENHPSALMRIFHHVQSKGLPIHSETKDIIRGSLYLVDDRFRQDPENCRLFREMMSDYRNLGQMLFAMHEVHFLDEWLPEFKKLRCRVQHDIYHIYTIDTHSIFAVNELSKLFQGAYAGSFGLFAEALREVSRPFLLTMGLFYHDIGKGEGGNHSVKGAEIADRATKRLGYTPEEQKIVEFLVISHLMMPHLSQRRDLEDQSMIIEFARSMGSVENLNMLFLLTWADIRAVGPEAWTDWKGSLLERLYQKTREVIEKGEFSKEKTYERIERVKEALLLKMGEKYPKEDLQRYLSSMPPRYFFAVSESEAERHFQLVEQVSDVNLSSSFRYLEGEKMHEMILHTLNAPRVFSAVTGVMAANAVNIFGAEVFQRNNGWILLILKITDAQGKPIERPEQFDAIQKSLFDVLSGRVRVDELIARRQLPEYLLKKPVQKAEGKVVIDNDVSAYYTVIDVYAHDRLGLLYDITRTLNRLGCYVEVSKISTKVEQVTDSFYVKDIFGKKIILKDKLTEIKKALTDVLEVKA